RTFAIGRWSEVLNLLLEAYRDVCRREARSTLTKRRDDWDMIRGLGQLAELAFQRDGGTTRCQRRRHQDVVDTKPEIAPERHSAVVPPAIQPPYLVMQKDGSTEHPGQEACQTPRP